MSAHPFRLSRETLGLFKDHKDFFQSVAGLYSETHLKVKLLDPEAKTSKILRENGDVELSFLYPLDDNDNAEDGRIYFNDTFVFNPTEEKFKEFKRSFAYNQKSSDTSQKPQWEEWLAKYQHTAIPTADQAKAFATTAGRSVSRELGDNVLRALATQKSYLMEALGVARSKNENWRFKLKDEQSYFNIVYRQDKIEVTLAIVVDDDEDAANGRVFFKDKFTLDAKTQALLEFQRQWEVAPEAKGDFNLEAQVEQLNQQELTVSKEKESYIQTLLPVILPLTEEGFGQIMGSLAPGGPPELQGKLDAVDHEKEEALKKREEVQIEGLEIIFGVAGELLERRYDGDQGWWNKGKRLISRKKGINFEKDKILWQSLHDKALARIQEQKETDKSVFDVLKQLELNGEEKALVDWLVSQKVLQRINNVERDLDTELRHDNLLYLAREDLWKKEGLFQSSIAVAKFLEESSYDSVKRGAQELTRFAEGKAGLGSKLEFMLPHYAKEATKPSMLVGMMGAGVLGVGAEALALRGVGRLGWLGKMMASGTGILGEAASFTALHRLWESAGSNWRKVWQGYGDEMGGAALLFTALRMVHFSAGMVNSKMAQWKWSSKPTASGEASTYLLQPSGRLILRPVTRQLNKVGGTFGFLLNHGGAVGAMWGVESAKRKWISKEPNPQGHLGNLSDALLMYTQAMVGFNLANRLTGGQLHAAVAGSRLRLDQMKLEAAARRAQAKARKTPSVPPPSGERKTDPSSKGPAPLPPKRRAPDAPKAPRPGEPGIPPPQMVFKLEFPGLPLNCPIYEHTQRIWIGKNPMAPEGFVSPRAILRDVEVNLLSDDTISHHHAILIKHPVTEVWYLGDQGSAYGTYVDGKKLRAGAPHLIEPGTKIRLGRNLEFTFDVQGSLPKVEGKELFPIDFIPVPRLQPKLPPPQPAPKFPFDVLYPGEPVPGPSVVEVASIVFVPPTTGGELPAGVKQSFYSDGTHWQFERNGQPIGTLYVDELGKFVVVNEAGALGVKVNGRVVEGWTFIDNGEKLNFGEGDWVFHWNEEVPTEVRQLMEEEMPIPLMNRIGENSVVTQRGELGLLDDILEAAGEGIKTQRMAAISVPILESSFLPEELNGLPAGEGPMRLKVLEGGRVATVTSPDHTSLFLGAASSSGNPADQISFGTRNEHSNHAQIYFGSLHGRRGWFLHDMTSGDVYFNSEHLKINQVVELTDGAVITVGAPEGQGEKLKVIFEVTPRLEISPPPGEGEAEPSTRRWLNETVVTSARPAETFPPSVLQGLPRGLPPMRLINKNQPLTADRLHTFYVLGAEIPLKELPPQAGHLQIQGARVSGEHAVVFIDEQGEWWVRDLNTKYGTYLNGKRLPRNETHKLNHRDVIGLGGGSEDSADSSRLFTFFKAQTAFSIPRPKAPPRRQPLEPDEDPESSRPTIRPPSPYPPPPEALPSKPPGRASPAPTPEELIHRLRNDYPAPPPHRGPPPPPGIRSRSPLPPPPRKASPIPPPPGIKPPSPLPPPPVAKRPSPVPPPPGMPPVMPLPPPAPKGRLTPPGESLLPVVRGKAEPVSAPPRPKDEAGEELLDDDSRPTAIPGEISAAASAPVEDEPGVTTKSHRIMDLARPQPEGNPTVFVSALKPLLTGDETLFQRSLKALSSFPNPEEIGLGRVKVNSQDFLNFLKSSQNHPMMSLMRDLARSQATHIHPGYVMGSNGDFLRFSNLEASSAPKPNTVITLALKPGSESDTVWGVFDKLLTHPAPMEIVVPLQWQTEVPNYLGIFYHTDHAPAIHTAVRALATSAPEILNTTAMPFSHLLLDLDGQPIPGMGVMEYAPRQIGGTSIDPLQHRGDILMKAREEMNARLRGPWPTREDLLAYAKKVLEMFGDAGYDTRNPGFNQGSVEGDHKFVAGESLNFVPVAGKAK